MTWIKTVTPSPKNPELLEAMRSLAPLYPEEYSAPMPRLPDAVRRDSIMLAHSLLPQALYHAFGTHGALMDPSLPLSRRDHEMISTVVSAINDCFY